MFRILKTALAVACVMASISACPQQFELGIPSSALATITKMLPPGSRVDSVRLFNDFDKSASSVAVLTLYRAEWRIYVFSPHGQLGYAISWKSGILPDTFMASSASLQVETVDEHDAITFRGCVQHMCPDIFSSLVYVPSRHQAFIGTCRDGKTKLSFVPSANDKDILRFLKQDLRISDAYGTACGSDTKEDTK